MSAMPRKPLFPMIRHISGLVTPVLARTPLRANHITAVSLLIGLGAAWVLWRDGQSSSVPGAVLLFVYYVLDHCDGEIARLKNQTSEFGRQFDTFVDWIVHAAFFTALGIGHARLVGENVWMWLGVAAAVGCTINYALVLVLERFDSNKTEQQTDEAELRPNGATEWALFFFRELTRADFWFLVLALAVFDVLWVLLPAAAIGAQVYWMALGFRRVRRFST